jgi:hypothetical protein
LRGVSPCNVDELDSPGLWPSGTLPKDVRSQTYVNRAKPYR